MNKLQGFVLAVVFGSMLAMAAGSDSITVSNFRFVLEGCKQNQDRVVCRLNVTNTRTTKRDLGLYRPLNAQDSATFGQLYDSSGLPHRLNGAGYGNVNGEVFLTLQPGVPTRFEVAYQVNLEGKQIPMLSFSTSIGEVNFKEIVLQ